MSTSRTRAWVITFALGAGAALGAAGTAGAASGGSTTPDSNGRIARGGTDPARVSHGPGETLLTGTAAGRASAAALAAVPGATVIRVETDSAGSPYEAHLRKADGTAVTVKLDSGFKVTSTQSGFGGGPGH
jgi:hypothetical protein